MFADLPIEVPIQGGQGLRFVGALTAISRAPRPGAEVSTHLGPSPEMVSRGVEPLPKGFTRWTRLGSLAPL
jgi:hypothetical protein